MLRKNDFKNPIDWVIYKVNGKLPEQRTNLINNSLPPKQRKYPLKFYATKNEDRYNVHYKQKHLCTCHKTNIMDIQNYFDENYDETNIPEIREALKQKYNIKIKRNVKKNIRKSRIPKKLRNYKQNRPSFENKKNGRVQVRVNDKDKIHTLCSCYPYQKNDIVSEYDVLKRTHDLPEIKKILKSKYNLRKVNVKDNFMHDIHITQNGSFFYDGKFIKVDKDLYDVVNKYINKELRR